MIKGSVDFQQVYNTLNKLTQNQSQGLWYKVASAVFSKIIRNTQIGIDYDGNPFKDYSKMYKAIRTKKGLGLRVNLQNTSKMLQSLTIEADEFGFVIYISGHDNQQKATQVQNQGRVFLDWGIETIDAFTRAILREIDKAFEGVQ